MKTIASIVIALGFVVTVQAEDTNKSDAAPAKTQATEPPAATVTPVPVQGTVARAIITNGIENHEPIDKVTDVSTKIERISYFTELRGMEGQTVTHRLQHNGQTMAEVQFQVGGPRWRVFSSKKLAPTATGEWQVAVVDAGGNVIRSDTFMYTQAPAAAAPSGELSKDATTGAASTNAQPPAKQ